MHGQRTSIAYGMMEWIKIREEELNRSATDMQQTRKTNYTFKALSLVAMVLIVSGHAKWGGVDLAYNYFQPSFYHLAIFVFISGYFYNPDYERRPLEFVKKKTLRLLVPLYAINVSG